MKNYKLTYSPKNQKSYLSLNDKIILVFACKSKEQHNFYVHHFLPILVINDKVYKEWANKE